MLTDKEIQRDITRHNFTEAGFFRLNRIMGTFNSKSNEEENPAIFLDGKQVIYITQTASKRTKIVLRAGFALYVTETIHEVAELLASRDA